MGQTDFRTSLALPGRATPLARAGRYPTRAVVQTSPGGIVALGAVEQAVAGGDGTLGSGDAFTMTASTQIMFGLGPGQSLFASSAAPVPVSATLSTAIPKKVKGKKTKEKSDTTFKSYTLGPGLRVPVARAPNQTQRVVVLNTSGLFTIAIGESSDDVALPSSQAFLLSPTLSQVFVLVPGEQLFAQLVGAVGVPVLSVSVSDAFPEESL